MRIKRSEAFLDVVEASGDPLYKSLRARISIFDTPVVVS